MLHSLETVVHRLWCSKWFLGTLFFTFSTWPTVQKGESRWETWENGVMEQPCAIPAFWRSSCSFPWAAGLGFLGLESRVSFCLSLTSRSLWLQYPGNGNKPFLQVCVGLQWQPCIYFPRAHWHPMCSGLFLGQACPGVCLWLAEGEGSLGSAEHIWAGCGTPSICHPMWTGPDLCGARPVLCSKPLGLYLSNL